MHFLYRSFMIRVVGKKIEFVYWLSGVKFWMQLLNFLVLSLVDKKNPPPQTFYRWNMETIISERAIYHKINNQGQVC